MTAIESLRELLEICRVKCSPLDEVILPNGRTNEQAMIDACEVLAEFPLPKAAPKTLLRNIHFEVGALLCLSKDQFDDDELGAERVTPRGAIIRILSIEDSSHGPSFHVGCALTGGNWFYSEADIIANTRAVMT